MSGIPVTHRGLASAFVVVSGHAREAYEPVLSSLTPLSATVVILMGIASRAATCALLIERGWPAATPAALLFSASRDDASSWRGTLASLAGVSASDGPGVIVVGETVALATRIEALSLSHAGGPHAVAR